jgi:hypothetical protein
MCVSTALANFAGTTLFLGKKMHPVHGTVFVLGYQNTVQNLSDGPNAMLLHLPAMYMTPENFLDTRQCRSILKDMVRSFMPHTRSAFGGLAAKGKSVQVFDHDIYTIVLAENAALIPDELYRVPDHKRIAVNQPLFDFYARYFRSCAVALCCFDNRQAREAAPLLMWYKPTDPYFFQLPALDCHTGEVPSLTSPVAVDHWVILASDDMQTSRSHTVHYSDMVPSDVRAFLPDRVIGRYFSGRMRNGDFGIAHSDVYQGRLAGLERIDLLAIGR